MALHIAQDSLDAALRWLGSVDDCLKLLRVHPGAGPARRARGALEELPAWELPRPVSQGEGGIEVVRVYTGRSNLAGSSGDGVRSESLRP